MKSVTDRERHKLQVNALTREETLEREQSCKLDRRGGGEACVILYKAQMVPEKHVTEGWRDGGIWREECLSVCLTDQGAPRSQRHRLQHLGEERQTSGSVKEERDVLKNTKFKLCPEGSANIWSLIPL